LWEADSSTVGAVLASDGRQRLPLPPWDYCDIPICDRVANSGFLPATGFPLEFDGNSFLASEAWGTHPLAPSVSYDMPPQQGNGALPLTHESWTVAMLWRPSPGLYSSK
jgi:hypothetical protein